MTIVETGTSIPALPAITAPAVLLMPETKGRSSHLPKIDFIHITSAARARSMELDGLSVAQIALAMGLKTDTIWSFLQMQAIDSGE